MPTIFRTLAAEHRAVEALLDELTTPPAAAPFDLEARRRLLDHLVIVASRHEACEELVLWPAVRKRAAGGAALADSALAQERRAKFQLDALRFAPAEEDVVVQSAELAAALRSHIAFEEERALPALRQKVSAVGAAVLGAKYAMAAKLAPTRPHPRGPDTRAGFAARGLPAVMLDRFRDAVGGRKEPPVTPEVAARAPDALAVIEADHTAIDEVLRRLDRPGMPDAVAANDLVRRLSVHDAVERAHLYPLMRDRIPNGNARYAQWIRHHGEIAKLVAHLDRREPDDPHRRALVDEIGEQVRGHFEEERVALELLRDRLAAEELVALGRTLQAAKAKAPTRPHTHLAGAGAGARLSRMVAAPLDRARDALTGRR